MLQVVIFSLSFLLGGVLSQQCGDFTTNDVEGPFFVSNVPRKVSFTLYLFVSHLSMYNVYSQYKIAPDNDIEDPGQGAIIRGRVRSSFFLSLL